MARIAALTLVLALALLGSAAAANAATSSVEVIATNSIGPSDPSLSAPTQPVEAT